jgi:predicted TIM-barrel fold metal-dependent hydrolase
VTDTLALLDIRVIDTDTHVTEPSDLWTSRVARKWLDHVPRAEHNPATGRKQWRMGNSWLGVVGAEAASKEEKQLSAAQALSGRSEVETAPDRLTKMDQYGIYAQVLYPNIIGFEAPLFMRLGDELALVCTRAYNDFIAEFASADPNRLVPITMVPFWDREAAVKEMERCRGLGHKGVLFANKYEVLGLPAFHEPYWDRIYAAAQDLDLSVNFHVGFASVVGGVAASSAGMASKYDARDFARILAHGIMSNHEPIAALLTTGLCERFPRLKFVSVESGFGYIPYLVESLDWHWRLTGAHRQYPMLPSEYFRRQCYGCFWFERQTLPLLETYPDNFMFETDYPHPTSLSLAPISPADVLPSEHIRQAFAKVPPDIARKVLHDNAASVYHVNG